MKKGRPGFLNRKPRYAIRIRKTDGERVWKCTLNNKEYKTKALYFAENKE
jgi:hypothetical protein